ncbi:MAG: hypothetical protein AAGF81_10820 [Pseudomonadota bacterium]
MDWILAVLFSQVEVLDQSVPVLALITGVLMLVAIIRRAWPPFGVLGLVAIFAYWVPLLKQ